MKGLIVFGSSRSDGETGEIVGTISLETGFEVIDLLDFRINRFDYDNRFSGDDFLSVVERLIEAETIVFATPVYWYSMSGIMKDFFDRFTDLLRFEKEKGRLLRGKSMALISSSSGEDPPDYFVRPFEDTAHYLGMKFVGHLHSWVEDGDIAVLQHQIDHFVESITQEA